MARRDCAARAVRDRRTVGSQDGTLELSGLRRTYGEVVALDDLSFTVPPGQVFGFLGPNGAGKTTAMRAIVGVASLDSGTVRWNGEPIGARARSRIGYMPEERGLYPAMRVFEQLEYLARLHGMSATAAAMPPPGTGPIGSAWAAGARTRSRRCRWATSSACSSRPRWCTIRNCSCSTSPSPAWTRPALTR